ncbi:MAG TPA: nucleoside triphosphate pyrophosphohydrolase, partial [Candidatus Saccharimonadales bacterium]|nr:nucleoside triphosphate pyrophosphohydrolase [Candidatus Saccharimonadales bacterium]
VRDKIPADQELSGQRPVYHRLQPAEHAQALVEKLIEEAKEIPINDKAEAVKEIADVRQALEDLEAILGLSAQEIAAAQAQKFARNGGFKEGYFVESVSPDDGSDWDKYYGSEPDRFVKA